MDIFLLMGQSNMAGWGCSNPSDPWQPGDKEPVADVFVFGGTYSLATNQSEGEMAWRPAAHPLHAPATGFFGLGIDFARAYRGIHPERQVGLIPNAWPGSAIANFVKGTPHYENTIQRVQLARERGTLCGILWHQGESDTDTPQDADAYAATLDGLIADLRQDLDAQDLPFIVGDVIPRWLPSAPRERHEAIATVQSTLRGLQERLPHCGFVESIGMVGCDDIHFSRADHIKFGRRFAAKVAQMTGHDSTPGFPGTKDNHHGYVRHTFEFDGCPCLMAVPDVSAPGRPWIWRTEFFDAWPAVDLALLERGWHVAHIAIGDTCGAPSAIAHFDPFYREMTQAYGLADKVVLEGFSRGGLYAYNWATHNADKLAGIYGDAPVCNIKSWPGGKGTGKGSAPHWKRVIQEYGFKDEAEAMAYRQNPIDTLAPLAAADIPIVHVVGDDDDVVPVGENTAILEKRYRALGGRITVIHKPGCGHHPHSLQDPTPVVTMVDSFGEL